jgi:hypothetical protein
MPFHSSRPSLTWLLLSCLSCKPSLGQSISQQPPASDAPTFRATVSRVIVDVVVRDSNNKPVHGLTARDFLVSEDGRLQSILSFDVHDFDSPSISLPPNTPHPPANSFVNIPTTPERGPLYVILCVSDSMLKLKTTENGKQPAFEFAPAAEPTS